MDPATIEGEVVETEDERLSAYIEDVSARGFPLGLLQRILCALKACAYLAGAVLVAIPARLLFMSSLDLGHNEMPYFGAIVLIFDIGIWLVVVFFAIMALVNILAALAGKMTIEARQANESAES